MDLDLENLTSSETFLGPSPVQNTSFPSILQQSNLIKHFCILNDKKNFQKSRKKSEQDKIILGANFKYAEINSEDCIITTDMKGENELTRSKKLHELLTSQISALVGSAHQGADVNLKFVSPSIKNLMNACSNLGSAFTEHRSFGCLELGNAFTNTSSILNDINTELVSNPKNAFVELSDHLWVHREKLKSWPNLFNINELTLHKMKDADNLRNKAKKKPEELESLDKIIEVAKVRTNRVLTITQAEINHHTTEIVKDSRKVMMEFLKSKIEMHRKVMEQYQLCLDSFSNVPLPNED